MHVVYCYPEAGWTRVGKGSRFHYPAWNTGFSFEKLSFT